VAMSAERSTHASITPELELLLLCARTGADPAATRRIGDLLAGDLDWISFVRAALGHDVLPLVSARLRAIGAPAVPAEILDRLGHYFADHTRGNKRLAEETLGLLGALQTEAIPALALKGPALAVAVYGDLALRAFVDLDFLIRRGDALRAKAIMLQLGYRLLTPVDDTGWPGGGATYSFDFAHPNKPWSVELHWRLSQIHMLDPLSFEQWRGRQRRVALEGRPVPTLTAEDTLVALCVHGDYHYWAVLKWICDVAELLRATPDLDWRRVETDARKLGCWRMVGLGLRLASDVLQAPIPDLLLARLRRDPRVAELADRVLRRLLAAEDPNAAEAEYEAPYHPYQLLERPRDWLWNARRTLIVSSNDRRLVRLPDRLAFAYYPVRLTRLCLTYGAGMLIRWLRLGAQPKVKGGIRS